MAEIVRDGGRLYYEVHGQGRPVVLLHGRGGNSLIWWQQIDAVAARYRCMVIDHRGWGRSTGPMVDPWLDMFADDLAAILDAEGVGEVALVAQSMGGYTANAFCARHPGRVRAAVMSGTTGGRAPAALLGLQRQASERSEAMRVAWSEGRGPHPAVGARMYAEQPALARLYEMINALNHNPTATGFRPARPDAVPLSLPAATLFITGEEDPLCPTPIVEACAAELGGSRLLRVPEAGHSTYFERAAAYNRAALTFLAEVYA